MSTSPLSTPSSAPDGAVLGLDNVRLELPLASLGSRTLAATIDQLMLLVLDVIFLLTVLIVLPGLGLSGGWVLAIVLIGIFVLQWTYFAVLEIAMDGRTPGKQAVGLRVVSARGGRTSAMAVLVRNFLRGIDLFIGVPLMMIDRRSRRLGDLVAGTQVVHHRDDAPDEIALGAMPAGWGAAEAAVAESFLRRAARMEPARAQRLAGRLLERIGSPVDESPEGDGDRVATLRRALGVSD